MIWKKKSVVCQINFHFLSLKLIDINIWLFHIRIIYRFTCQLTPCFLTTPPKGVVHPQTIYRFNHVSFLISFIDQPSSEVLYNHLQNGFWCFSLALKCNYDFALNNFMKFPPSLFTSQCDFVFDLYEFIPVLTVGQNQIDL